MSSPQHKRLEFSLTKLAEILRPSRPMIAFDLEATGPYPDHDRICEMAVAKWYTDGRVTSWSSLIQPTVPIPAEATAVHHITNEMVANAPTFAACAPILAGRFSDCILIGYNLRRFDVVLLKAEFTRAGVDFDPGRLPVLDGFKIFQQKEARHLSAALFFYTGEVMDEAHRGDVDVAASLEVLVAQLVRYTDVPRDVDALAKYCLAKRPEWIDPDGKFKWSDGHAVVGFGKHAGKRLADIDDGFFRWIIDNTFSDEVKAIARQALQGVFPVHNPAQTEDVAP